MSRVAYASPWVPAEWIAAHGFQPDWVRLGAAASTATSERRGVCPYAGAVLEAFSGSPSDDGGLLDAKDDPVGLVLTTTCDQMRYAASVLDRDARQPVFLLNVPSTCDGEAASLYRDELMRLGHFLERLGGREPSADRLADMTLRYSEARDAILSFRGRLSSRQMAEMILAVRRGERVSDGLQGNGATAGLCGSAPVGTVPVVPLALFGGPLADGDFELLDMIESAGGRIVLDASEAGERTLPAAPNVERLRRDPLGELARIYFETIPDVFRRPNGAMYRWLDAELSARVVRGIIFRRYVWCDLWHAELTRLKERSPVPVLELDVGNGEHSATGRTVARLEAFLEMLR